MLGHLKEAERDRKEIPQELNTAAPDQLED